MKTLLAAACLIWMTLATELAWPTAVPHGALLLPIVCGVMFWTRSTSGLMLSGIVLLLDWIARPSALPLCGMLLPFAAAMCLAPSAHREEFRSGGLSLEIPGPLQLPVLTLVAVLLHLLGTIPLTSLLTPTLILPDVLSTSKSLCIIALPVSAVLTLIIRIADEFGLRRSFVI
jgi:hypothetical protein